MTANDVVLLQGMIERSRHQTRAQLSETEHATFWVCEQYLKHYGLGHEDLLAGNVDGEKDCGVDALFCFVNGIYLRDDTPVDKLGRYARIDLVVIQAKDAAGFGEAAIDKLIVNLPRLLSFARDEHALSKFANSRLIEATRRFLQAYRDLEMPSLHIYVAFASLRATQLHPATLDKAAELERICGQLFAGCPIQTAFLDASALCDLAREIPTSNRKLQLAENPISTDTAGGYVAVVRLDDYERFITSDTGELDAGLFEANVRDYEGETSVNKSIQETLSTEDEQVDFWWLNNGVTVVASRVQLANKLLELESPQIVNGLQTSTEIYKRSRADGAKRDPRSVLVKVIEARDPQVRENIIRATNSQTSFGPSALRATDKVQRQIEEYLAGRALWYERRRRQYYNMNKPLDRIISIDTMGQAVLSVVAQKPHIARGTSSKVFEETVYDLVFHPEHPVQMYAACIELLRQCDAWLRHARDGQNIEDFRFQMAMLAGSALSRKNQPNGKDIAALLDLTLPGPLASDLLDDIEKEYEREARRSSALLLDQLAKSESVTVGLLDRARTRLLTSRR
jgi:hypothetical protein